MQTADVMFKTTKAGYTGYVPQNVHEYDVQPPVWDVCKKLQRLPRKVSHFFNKEKIEEVRRTDFQDPLENSYYLKLIDGTFLEITY